MFFRMAEKNTDAILDGEKVKEDEPKDKKNKSHDEFIEETVAKRTAAYTLYIELYLKCR